MLPAHLHIEVARDCVVYKRALVTASYVSDAMQELSCKENNLIFMNEIDWIQVLIT
jgi:protocatechuate 3,4-dioxygenase beta subunit